MSDESLRADREVVLAAIKSSGGALEYADESLRADVSQQWSIAQSLHLDGLVRANEIVAKGPEIMATWNALITLDRNGAYEVGRVMGMKGSRVSSVKASTTGRSTLFHLEVTSPGTHRRSC